MSIVMTESSENPFLFGRVGGWFTEWKLLGGVSENIKLSLPSEKGFNYEEVQEFICRYDCMISVRISDDP